MNLILILLFFKTCNTYVFFFNKTDIYLWNLKKKKLTDLYDAFLLNVKGIDVSYKWRTTIKNWWEINKLFFKWIFYLPTAIQQVKAPPFEDKKKRIEINR